MHRLRSHLCGEAWGDHQMAPGARGNGPRGREESGHVGAAWPQLGGEQGAGERGACATAGGGPLRPRGVPRVGAVLSDLWGRGVWYLEGRATSAWGDRHLLPLIHALDRGPAVGLGSNPVSVCTHPHIISASLSLSFPICKTKNNPASSLGENDRKALSPSAPASPPVCRPRPTGCGECHPPVPPSRAEPAGEGPG